MPLGEERRRAEGRHQLPCVRDFKDWADAGCRSQASITGKTALHRRVQPPAHNGLVNPEGLKAEGAGWQAVRDGQDDSQLLRLSSNFGLTWPRSAGR